MDIYIAVIIVYTFVATRGAQEVERDRREEHSGEGEGKEQELGGKEINAFAKKKN